MTALQTYRYFGTATHAGPGRMSVATAAEVRASLFQDERITPLINSGGGPAEALGHR